MAGLAAEEPQWLGCIGDRVYLGWEVGFPCGDGVERRLKDGCTLGVEKRLADLSKASLNYAMILLLEMEGNGISDISINKRRVILEDGIARAIKPTNSNIVVGGRGEKSDGRENKCGSEHVGERSC
jgi:hypothetical protein